MLVSQRYLASLRAAPISRHAARRAMVICPRAAASGSPAVEKTAPLLELHISNDTTVSVPISFQAVRQLQAAIVAVLQTFAAKQKAERPQRWPMMEWRFRSSDDPEASAGSEVEFFEVYCNPNGFGSAFEAKALMTLWTQGGVKVSSEAKLAALQADVESFMQQQV